MDLLFVRRRFMFNMLRCTWLTQASWKCTYVLTRWQQYFIRIECNLTYVNVYPFQSGLDNEKIAWLHSCRLILYLQLILYWNIVFRVIWNQFTDLINRVRNWIHKIVYIYIYISLYFIIIWRRQNFNENKKKQTLIFQKYCIRIFCFSFVLAWKYYLFHL